MSIMQVTPAAASSSQAEPFLPYAKRDFAFIDVWHEGAWALKGYQIHHELARARRGLAGPLVAAARVHVRDRLPDAEREGHHHHLGSVIPASGVQGQLAPAALVGPPERLLRGASQRDAQRSGAISHEDPAAHGLRLGALPEHPQAGDAGVSATNCSNKVSAASRVLSGAVIVSLH